MLHTVRRRDKSSTTRPSGLNAYDFWRDSKKRYSCVRQGRSSTLSGIAFVLCQITSARKYHPASCNANATRHGIPIKSLGFSPLGVLGRLSNARAAYLSSEARYVLFPLA